jgi:xanthine dehydrogenase accessory factor
MTVEVASAKFTSEVDGETYWFCCPACKKLFEDAPAEYVAS